MTKEEKALLEQIAAAKAALLARKVQPVGIMVAPRVRAPGLVSLFEKVICCENCKRYVGQGTKYILVKRNGRRLRYHEVCAPKEEVSGTQEDAA